jgi:hypothetical protein
MQRPDASMQPPVIDTFADAGAYFLGPNEYLTSTP